MRIEDSLVLKDKTMAKVKASLEKVSEIDNKEEFRVDMLEYINQSSYNNDDMFFYDMMEFIRFLKPSSKSVAYTDPNHLVFLNSPGVIGESVRQWDFIYDHECLHQLWDTFGVEDKIKKEIGWCDHMLLNIASDCVINDYLYYYRKKERPDGLITPDLLEDKYGVVYNRREDTQYTLYLKLLEAREKLMKDIEKLKDMLKGHGDDEDSDSDDSSDSDSNQNGKSRGGESASSNKSSNSSGSNGDEDDDDEDSGSGNKKSNGSDSGSEDENGDKSGSKGGSDKDGEEDKSGKDKSDGSKGKDKKDGDEYGKEPGNSKKGGHGAGSDDQLKEDLDEIRRNAEDIIDSYKKKISGAFGEFINKCKVSQKCNKDGLAAKTQSGNPTSWNQEMSTYINAFIKNKIFKKKRMTMSTYSRVRRGSGPVKFGQPILPGRKVVEETFDIKCAFYIDKSGSMATCIEDVFKATYRLADAIKKQFSREKVVGATEFDMYAFDDKLMRLDFGNKANADGGTMSFDSLLDHINQNSKDFLINVIITDAGFSGIDESAVKKFIDGLEGIILFITNCKNKVIHDIADEKKGKLFYILADTNFTVK